MKLYQKLLWYSINMSFTVLAPIISKVEKRVYQKYASQKIKHHPIFIVGCPRSGSTILYQSVTNKYNVLYINNFTCINNRYFFVSFWLSNLFFRQKAHNSFGSTHGSTIKFGLNAPSECGNFWYRWFSRDSDEHVKSVFPKDRIEEMRKEITAVSNYFDKPILFKNLNNSLRLDVLKDCFPEAQIIYIQRDIYYNAQSILMARRKIGVSSDEFWSVTPSRLRTMSIKNEYQLIINQIRDIGECIEKQKALFSKNSFYNINYEELDDEKSISILNEYFLKLDIKKDFENYSIKVQEKVLLSEEEVKKLKREIANVYE